MDSIIRINEVVKRLGISRTTLWRLEHQGSFIPRVRISKRSVGYFEADVQGYLKSKTENIAEVKNDF